MADRHQSACPSAPDSSGLNKGEVKGLLAAMDGVAALLARLLYGTGMRLMEGMRLRVKNVDFDHHVIIVREVNRRRCFGQSILQPKMSINGRSAN